MFSFQFNQKRELKDLVNEIRRLSLIVLQSVNYAMMIFLICCSTRVRLLVLAIDAKANSKGAFYLLKSKSGFLIRKQIFRFFTKFQKRIIDQNDPQRRWIL